MYCSFHRVKQWDFDVTILLKALRNYQEWNNMKKSIRKTSKND